MSVILHHRKFPFVMVYSDPKRLWDSTSKKRLLEEIKKDGFDNFIEADSVPSLFYNVFSLVDKNKTDDNDKEESG